MKSAQLEQDEKPIKETVIILDPYEAKHVALAVEAYAKLNKRSKKIQKLAEDIGLCSMFY